MVTDTRKHIGNIKILSRPLFALLCSRSYPAGIILPTHDATRQLRDDGMTVISGFHSPMEKECLHILLRGTQPIVLCTARSVQKMRVPAVLRKHIDGGRLLIISPFGTDQRLTAELSAERNVYIASLAKKIFVPYATPGGRLESLCRKLLAKRKIVYTIESPYNANLSEIGARVFRPKIA